MDKLVSWPTRTCVIGEGPKSGERVASGLKVRFNHRKYSDSVLHEDASVLWISNLRHKKGDAPGFISEGAYASTELDISLQKKAYELCDSLGCWPSSGLTTVMLLAGKVQRLRVYQMPLLPSLIRPARLHSRMPLPCTFHNWLGERRLALLSKFEATPPWSSLFLVKPPGGNTISGDQFQDLLSLPHIPREQGLKLLIQLDKVSATCWLSLANLQYLKAAERLFYLERQINQTRNWWLYDHDASGLANAIRGRLAWCQQKLMVS